MEKKYIQSIVRACDILDYIAMNKKVRLNELTKEFGLAKTTIFGILSTLEYKNMVYKDENSNYYLGIKNYTYGKVYESDFNLKRIIHPFLEKLVEKYNETAHMGIEDSCKVLYIDRVRCSHSVRMESNIGGRDPLYCTSIGKLILSFKSESEIQEYMYSVELKKRTDNTITNIDEMLKEIKKIKEQGYAIDNEELEKGLICVSAPVFVDSKFSAVVSISGPTGRIDKDTFNNMIKDVTKICRNISELL